MVDNKHLEKNSRDERHVSVGRGVPEDTDVLDVPLARGREHQQVPAADGGGDGEQAEDA